MRTLLHYFFPFPLSVSKNERLESAPTSPIESKGICRNNLMEM